MSRDSYLQEAFNQVCKEAKQPECWYVVLMESTRVYAGPWEGGTWVTDTFIVAYQEFPSEKLASHAAWEIEKLASELQNQARASHGEYCLRTMEWLDARGLDADFLPEPDGPSEYYVRVCEELPVESRGPREYS